jgi:RHS repeat-associated protein
LDSTGVVQAHYEYDAFGNTLVSTGAKVNDFAHRFSTKPRDAETGLYYYGYRYYDPVTGRWPSRDPIGERGGMNLYDFVVNNGVNKIDYLGLTADRDSLNEAQKKTVAAKLSEKCNDKCLKRCGSCTKDKCKKEARRIAEVYVDRVEAIRRPDIPDVNDRHCGWLCYQWAGLVLRQFRKEKFECWRVFRVGNAGGTKLSHHYLFAALGPIADIEKGPVKDCGVALDPWQKGEPYVCDPTGVNDWNYIHGPRGCWRTGMYWNGKKWVSTHNDPVVPSEP